MIFVSLSTTHLWYNHMIGHVVSRDMMEEATTPTYTFGTMRLPLPPPSSSLADGSSSDNGTRDVMVPSSASRASGMFLFLFGSLIKFTNTNTIYLWGYTVQGQGRGPTLYAYISMKFYSNQNHSGRDSYFYY
jgi:hypothetical protein